MKSAFASLVVAGLSGLGAAGAALAEDVIAIADPEIVLEVAKGFGSAELDKDKQGDPVVNGRDQGVKYTIYFYGCTDGASCRSIQFYAVYEDKLGAEKTNEWNVKYRWIKAFADDGTIFSMDVDFKGGITRANLEEYFTTWDNAMFNVRTFISG